VNAGMKLRDQEEFYLADEGGILGDENFVDATIHRIGASPRPVSGSDENGGHAEFSAERLIEAVEKVCRVSRREFCGSGKARSVVTAKELFMLIGCEAGASPRLLADIAGISPSAVSRRYDAARLKLDTKREVSKLAASVRKCYWQR